MLTQKVRVGLVLSHSLSYCREILRGVRTFAMEHPDWLLTPIFPDSRAVKLAASLKCNGYIAHIFERSLFSDYEGNYVVTSESDGTEAWA
jgi:hypothetical protein